MPDIETIGKYEVLEVIGEGGFGIVYKARDPLMERLVAIKVCSTEDEHIRKRFLREAKIAGGLDHPNIVIAFDFGTEQNLPYLVQELLTGEDLRAKIDRQETIDPRTKLDYLVQIAKGLQHAHAQGVLHRDIKPANVRILDDKRAKLMDFGMAKITNETGTRLTADGSVMGTAGYFAPEQLKALELDQRVDIFSFGVLAYELLTYRKVFPGDTFMVVFRQVLHDEPEPVVSVWPECPAELAALVEKCLSKEPENRFSSFAEILPILYALLGSTSFDRRSEHRGHEDQPEPAATVLKPLSEMVAPAPVEPTPPSDDPKESPQTPPPKPVAEPPQDPVPEPVSKKPPVETPVAATGKAPKQEAARARVESKSPGPVKAAKVPLARNKWIVVGASIVLAVVLGIWLLAGSGDEAAQPTPIAEPVDDTRTEAPTPVPSTLGFAVFVEASPWGEIAQIVDDAGEEVSMSGPLFTPIVLRLPVGSYDITVASPDSVESDTCHVLVSEEAAQTCKVLFSPPDPIDYFKEAGWWE